jgi:ribonuclease P protein component
MFPRKNRLPRGDFKALPSGKRLSSPNFSLVVPREASGYAVVVPKAVLRLSVARHRVKRRVLAVLRKLHLPSALVVFPKKSAASLSSAEMYEELRALLERFFKVQ